jgi:hypothetical protein
LGIEIPRKENGEDPLEEKARETAEKENIQAESIERAGVRPKNWASYCVT